MAINRPSDNLPLADVLRAGVPAICAHLQAHGWQVEREHLLVRGFPVQFLAAHGLTEEAVREAEHIEYEGVPAKVFRAEHIVAMPPAWVGPKTRLASSNCSSRPTLTEAAWKTSCNGIS